MTTITIPGRCDPASSPMLTPQETYAGFQGEANRVYVAGWAWDARHPDLPVTVAIYDGDRQIGTVVANIFQPDLRAAGIGNGHHAFVYLFPVPIRDRAPHVITVRVAGTAITLRDHATGGLPRPVTHRDVPPSRAVPHFSLSPLARWWYFTVLKTLFRPFPSPVWRFPATLFAWLMVFTDAEGRRLDTALLAALGLPHTPSARWRQLWRRCYLQQTDLLMRLQTERFTKRWLRRQVRLPDTFPHGGAILIAPHHALQFLATYTISGLAPNVGVISSEPPNLDDPRIDPTLVLHWRQMRLARERVFSGHLLSRQSGARQGLRLLREGGYVIVIADDFLEGGTPVSLLGRAMPLPRGALWLARQSGKPIIPMMLIPSGRRWRLWFGAPVAPTYAGVTQGLAACLRQSPGSWSRLIAIPWLHAPLWQPEHDPPAPE